MSSTLYQIYKAAVFQLCSTAVINHPYAATAINNVLLEQNVAVDQTDPTTWKYYMNMAGLYHSSDMVYLTAVQGVGAPYMSIMVAGNNGPVPADFTVDLINGLNADTATANVYQFGTPEYNALLSRYPTFRGLINGILNPIPLSMSTTANDGEILSLGGYTRQIVNTATGLRGYQLTNPNNTLVEAAEDNLTTELQQWIYTYIYRWDNPAYSLTDDLYVAVFLGIMAANMPGTILNIRLANCLTPRAHSYHIKQYAESFGYLSRYVPYLNTQQNLYLYRNFRYLRSNSGKQSTFNALITNVLNPLHVPLAGYDLQHDLSDMPPNIYPNAVMQRIPLNFTDIGASSATLTIPAALALESTCARQNTVNIDEVAADVTAASIYSRYNTVPTKLLQSEMIDNIGSAPLPLNYVLMNMWIWSATNGLYTGNVYVTHPVTGVRLQLTPLNALILAMYCWNVGYLDTVPVTIPAVWAWQIPLPQTVEAGIPLPAMPDFATMHGNIDHTRLAAQDIFNVVGTYLPKYTFNSNKAFLAGCTANWRELQRRYTNYTQYQDGNDCAQIQNVTNMTYSMYINCDLAPGVTYVDWLGLNGISTAGMGQTDYITLATDLVEQATGVLVDPAQTLGQSQAAALAIMQAFSSYTVQYVSSITAQPTIVCGFSAFRMNNLRSTLGLNELGHVRMSPSYTLQPDSIAPMSLGMPALTINFKNPDDTPRMAITMGSPPTVSMVVETPRPKVQLPGARVLGMRFVGLTQG